MKSTNKYFTVSVLALAVQGALAAMAAMPMIAMADDNADLKALTQPTSFVEVGASNVSNGSDKFGEYNGLEKSGVSLIGNLDVRGGDGYGDKGGTTRWDVYGKDLGTTSREFGLDVSDQGVWNFGLHRDELTHYITDSFQTPFQGAMGGNAFVLPSNFGIVNLNSPYVKGVIVSNPALYGTQGLSAAQVGDFQSEEIHSGRTNTGMTAGFAINKQWTVQFDYNRLAQDGAKLISAASDGFGTSGIVGPGFIVPTYGSNGLYNKGEAPVMLANPTNFSTDTITLTTNWVGEKAHFTASLYGSIFHDNNSQLTWTTPYLGGSVASGANGSQPGIVYPVDALSLLPSNTFVQGNLSGGFAITPTTKLTGGFSYGRNTQNAAYVNVPGGVDNLMMNTITLAGGATAPGLPQGSLNGLVITTHADLKLVDRSVKDWTFSGGLKYNERDNQTAANPYGFLNINSASVVAATGAASAAMGNPLDMPVVNTPYSNKKTEADLGADYKISQSQNVRFGYNYEKIERWCDSGLANNAGLLYGATPNGGGTVASYYGTTASCVQVPDSTENKVGVNYRLRSSDDLSLNAGYSYAKRNANVLSAFYSPLASQADGEGYENLGYIAFFDASRKEQLLKAGVNWQANDRFNVGLNGKYTKDNYDESTLGIQNGSSWSVNLDGTFQLSEKGSFSAYATAQKRERDLLTEQGRHVAALGTTLWEQKYSDSDYTIGLNLKQGGLLSDKLTVAADLTYSNGTTGWNTSVPAGSTFACAVPGVQPNGSYTTSGYNCGATPDINSKLAQLKLSGVYSINKQSQLGFGVLFQHLNSDDFIYNAYQMGYSPTSVMPSNQSSPSYSVSQIYAVYRYNFSCL